MKEIKYATVFPGNHVYKELIYFSQLCFQGNVIAARVFFVCFVFFQRMKRYILVPDRICREVAEVDGGPTGLKKLGQCRNAKKNLQFLCHLMLTNPQIPIEPHIKIPKFTAEINIHTLGLYC